MMNPACSILIISVITAIHTTISLKIPGSNIDLPVFPASSDKVTYGDPKCKNCTDYVYSKFDSLKATIKKFDNLIIESAATCSYCIATGIDSLHPIGDACNSTVSNNPNQTDTKLHMIIDSFMVKCFCSFSNVLPYLQNQLTNFKIPAVSCGLNVNQGSQIVEDGVKGALAVNELIDIQKLPSCIELDQSKGDTNVTLTMTRQNYTFLMVVREDKTLRGPKSTWVESVEETSPKFENMDVKCDSDITSSLCTCIVDSQVFKVVCEDSASYFMNCALKNESDLNLRSALNAYVSCAKLP